MPYTNNLPVEVTMNYPNTLNNMNNDAILRLKKINRIGGYNPAYAIMDEGAVPSLADMTMYEEGYYRGTPVGGYLNYFEALIPKEVLAEFKATGWVIERAKMYAIAPDTLIEIAAHKNDMVNANFVVKVISLRYKASSNQQEKITKKYVTDSVHTALLMGLVLLSSSVRI